MRPSPRFGERLAVSFLASLIGGLVAALVGGDRMRAPLGTGIVMLLVFVPYHTTIWTQFPPLVSPDLLRLACRCSASSARV